MPHNFFLFSFTMNKQFAHFKEVIESKKTFVITTHINPDGDAIGCETALARFLNDRGKSVTILNQSGTPDNLKFLEAIFPVNKYDSSKHEAFILNAGCFIVVDTNSPSRFKIMKQAVEQSHAYKICIDHHLEQEPFADEYIIDTEAPATGELLYRILTFIDEKGITSLVAQGLYAGIMTDTGSFRFPKTDSETHEITADLLNRGVDPSEVFRQIYENGPLNNLQLLGKALNSITLHHGGKIAVMKLPRRIFQETNTKESDVDNLTQYVLSIRGVQAGVVVTELDEGIKLSFRSKGDIPINDLAKLYGGGGHKNAAGARVKGMPLEDVVSEVLEKAKSFV